MKKKSFKLTQKGFTLIEILSVMVIMSVMSSVAVQKFDLLSTTTGDRALHFAVKELNIRESLTWTNLKLSDDGWTNDGAVFAGVKTEIGPGFRWSPNPTAVGGTLHYSSNSIVLTRIPSTKTSAGKWR